MQIGNEEVSDTLFLDLKTHGIDVRPNLSECEVYLTVERMLDLNREVLEVARIIANARPDECEWADGELRLWWD